MSRNTKLTILIVNTVACLILAVVSVGVMIASVMGGASAQGHEILGTLIVMLGMGAPAAPLVSIAGSWATMKWDKWSMLFVALPYAYGLVLAGVIALLFAQG
ncbi:MAG TPA: hypothetical protein VHL59_04720 [Thermoanaerobaculia bacterium]|nr:hypothetical protein [Thermoanaerobaculia bacterium]